MEKRFRAPFSQRRSLNKPPRKRFVIVCEGGRTETDYYNHLLQEWRSRFRKVDNYVSIEIVGPEAAGGNEPENLIEYAVNTLRETEKARRIWDKSSQIWCVFDVEAEGVRKNLTNSVSHAKVKKIRLVISNPCFELWLYLHHQYCGTAFADGKSMKAHLKNGGPSIKRMRESFPPSMNFAGRQRRTQSGCVKTRIRNCLPTLFHARIRMSTYSLPILKQCWRIYVRK